MKWIRELGVELGSRALWQGVGDALLTVIPWRHVACWTCVSAVAVRLEPFAMEAGLGVGLIGLVIGLAMLIGHHLGKRVRP